MGLQRGFSLSIENAMRAFGAGGTVAEEYPDKALGLAQLGQEEVGKSLSLLAAAALPPTPEAWDWLWSSWRNHELKAHRAYLYEIIHPLRIAIRHPEGGIDHEGGALLERLPAEKEVGFYVDFDHQLNTFVSPQEVVDGFAAAARLSTLGYLAATADALRRALFAADDQFRFRAFSEVALVICSQEIYQQDWPEMRAAFRARSKDHALLIEDLDIALRATADFFKSAVPPRNQDSPPSSQR